MKKILFILMALAGIVPVKGQTSRMSKADAERFVAYFYDSIRYEAKLNVLSEFYSMLQMPYFPGHLRAYGISHLNYDGNFDFTLRSNSVSRVKSRKKKIIKDLMIPSYQALHSPDYDAEADRARAKRLIKRFREEATVLPTFYQVIDKKYKGDVDAYVDDLFDDSFYGPEKRMKRFVKHPTRRKVVRDPAVLYSVSKSQYVALIRDAGYDDLLKDVILYRMETAEQ